MTILVQMRVMFSSLLLSFLCVCCCNIGEGSGSKTVLVKWISFLRFGLLSTLSLKNNTLYLSWICNSLLKDSNSSRSLLTSFSLTSLNWFNSCWCSLKRCQKGFTYMYMNTVSCLKPTSRLILTESRYSCILSTPSWKINNLDRINLFYSKLFWILVYM